nr:hypothetical protein [Lachnospiraceae bacterium]
TTKSRVGNSSRTVAPSAYGSNIYAYNPGSDYKNLLYVLELNGVVKGMYTISPYANFGNIVKSGMTVSEIESNGFCQNTNCGMSSLYTYEAEGYTVEAYVDINGTDKVYAIRCYSDDYDFDTMMCSDYNTENYNNMTSATYNGKTLYVSDEYDKEVVECMSAYRVAVGLSALTVYEGCGREMAEIGASQGYSSASNYTTDEKSIMKTAVKKAGSGQINTNLRSVFAGDNYSDPFTVVTNWSELGTTYSSLVDSTFNCVMGGFAFSPSYEDSFTYVVLWGATKGGLA